MMPDAELTVVGECVAEETSIVGGAGEGHRLVLSLGIDNDIYLAPETACRGVEIDSAEVVVERIELMTTLWESAGSTEIERTAVG